MFFACPQHTHYAPDRVKVEQRSPDYDTDETMSDDGMVSDSDSVSTEDLLAAYPSQDVHTREYRRHLELADVILYGDVKLNKHWIDKLSGLHPAFIGIGSLVNYRNPVREEDMFSIYTEIQSQYIVCRYSRSRYSRQSFIRAEFKPREKHSTVRMYHTKGMNYCAHCYAEFRQLRQAHMNLYLSLIYNTDYENHHLEN